MKSWNLSNSEYDRSSLNRCKSETSVLKTTFFCVSLIIGANQDDEIPGDEKKKVLNREYENKTDPKQTNRTSIMIKWIIKQSRL